MIITVSLNPALDKTLVVDGLTVDSVNRVAATRTDAGGKSINVAKIVSVLGGQTLATGIVGGATGQFIQTQLDQMGIRHDFVLSSAPTRTNLKITDRVRRTTTELNEAGAPVTEELLEKVWNKLNSVADSGDIVVISGANPPGMGDDVLARWICQLKQKGVFVALDTVGAAMRLGIEARPDVIKPNLSELSDLFGEQLHYLRDVIAAARHIVQQGVGHVIVSMGGDGALFATRDRILRCPGLKITLGSTVGSGDAMLAAVLHSMQEGRSLEETARWAIAAGSANAMCDGSQTPTAELIRELYEKTEVYSMN